MHDQSVVWDLDGEINWWPGEKEAVSRLPQGAQEEIRWAKRLRAPVDGRLFRVVVSGSSYSYVKEESAAATVDKIKNGKG